MKKEEIEFLIVVRREIINNKYLKNKNKYKKTTFVFKK